MLHIEELKPCVEAATKDLPEAPHDWVVATDGEKVVLFQRQNDGSLKNIVPNCDCVKDHLDISHIEPYLEAAQYGGKYEKLIVVGSAGNVEKLKNSFGEVLKHRIRAEVIEENINDSSGIKERLRGILP